MSADEDIDIVAQLVAEGEAATRATAQAERERSIEQGRRDVEKRWAPYRAARIAAGLPPTKGQERLAAMRVGPLAWRGGRTAAMHRAIREWQAGIIEADALIEVMRQQATQ